MIGYADGQERRGARDGGCDRCLPGRRDPGDGAGRSRAGRRAPRRPQRSRAAAPPKAPPRKPEVVRVGALINDIQQLDLQTHSYAVDIYLWFKWRNPDIDPSRTFEFLNPFELWGHIRQYAGVKPETLSDGEQYSSVHVQGKFNANLPLERYPFDTQNLVVELEDKNKDESGLVYVPDDGPDRALEGHHDPGLGHRRPHLRGRLEHSTRPTSATRAPATRPTRG